MIQFMMNCIDYLLSKTITILYSAIVIVGFIQVFSRYVFSLPLVWVEELTIYLFIWLTFFGAAMGVTRRAHVSVDFFVNLFPGSVKPFAYFLASGLSFIFMLIFTLLVTKLLQVSSAEISATVGIPLSLVYLGVFLGSLFMCINMLRLMVGDFKRGFKKEPH